MKALKSECTAATQPWMVVVYEVRPEAICICRVALPCQDRQCGLFQAETCSKWWIRVAVCGSKCAPALYV